MKIPRFFGGLTIGVGLSYLLFSTSVDDRITRNMEKNLLFGDLKNEYVTAELESLIKQRNQKALEFFKLKGEWQHKFAEEKKSYTREEQTRKSIAAVSDYFSVVSKRHLELMDVEMEWLKDALHGNDYKYNDVHDKSGDWIDSSR
ncbi:hypothetical protein ACHQM5_007572 [Ranunculus cassubicifolius]